MMELKCGTKITWCEPYSMSIKEGIIVNENYDVLELNTGLFYNVRNKDINCVLVDGEWVGYEQNKPSSGYHRSSGRYPWYSVDAKAARGYIYSFKPKKVIFNGPATIVLWKDGTKTIVKCREGETDDKEKAIMYCIIKKMCGNKAAMDKYLKLFLKEELNNEEKA